MRTIIVIGGGAAGMMAAITAGRAGAKVHVYEKNEKIGKKLYITGKGRCNVTNACEDIEGLFDSMRSNAKFMYSAFYGFTNQDTIEFFEKAGMPVKVERGDRAFPVSDRAGDVLDALRRTAREAGVEVHLNQKVKKVLVEEEKITGVLLSNGNTVRGDRVIVATGGISYQTTGSTGDGYKFAEEVGHKVTETYPSLVPFNVKEEWTKELQGLALRNVEINIRNGKKELYRDFGEMLFTHFGISGPLILTGSSYVAATLKKQSLTLSIDLKPALSMEQLDQRILRDFEANCNKAFKNTIGNLFPTKLIPIMISLSEIDPDKKVNLITREERQRFVTLIKNLELTVTGLRDYNEAIITKGGVTVKEVNPSTMESKLVEGLYFAGEVLDLDAVTGGYNLQIAWSTGYLAGLSAAEE